jgi:aminopeptidase N
VTEAVVAGFAHPAQRELLAPYAARYFADIADVWRRRTSEHAQSVVIGLFPSWAVDPATVALADDWLADESHPPALRRLVTEGRAGIVRALAAREFDRS